MTNLTTTELELLKEMIFGDSEESLTTEELIENSEMLSDFLDIISLTTKLEGMKEEFYEKYLSDLDD